MIHGLDEKLIYWQPIKLVTWLNKFDGYQMDINYTSISEVSRRWLIDNQIPTYLYIYVYNILLQIWECAWSVGFVTNAFLVTSGKCGETEKLLNNCYLFVVGGGGRLAKLWRTARFIHSYLIQWDLNVLRPYAGARDMITVTSSSLSR